jgi:malate synthase
VPIARQVFDRLMPGPHQRHRRSQARVTAADLLRLPGGAITREGLRTNVEVSLRYLESWLRGKGCVPIHHLMEDAATAEISRAQIWQWVRHGAALEDGTRVTAELVRAVIRRELAAARDALGEEAYAGTRFDRAATLLEEIALAPHFPDFLTLRAYEHL